MVDKRKFNVAFIGLGHMGMPMACNLLKAGHSVTGFDIAVARCEEFVSKGGATEEDLVTAVSDVDVVITMLQTGDQVKEVLMGAKPLFSVAQEHTAFIDCSTIAPRDAVELHRQARRYHRKFLDSPVSGGVAGATRAELTFMVGGAEDFIEEVRPLLLAMGSRVCHAGIGGSGQSAKICNNLLLGITMIGTCEVLALGKRLGLDPSVLTEIVNGSSGRNWSLDTYNPVPGVMEGVPSSNEYQGGFQTSLMNKDLSLAMDAATGVGATTPLGAVAAHLYRAWCKGGGKNLDFSSIYKMLEPDNT